MSTADLLAVHDKLKKELDALSAKIEAVDAKATTQPEKGDIGLEGPVGPVGPRGEKGDQGPAGEDGVCLCPRTEDELVDLEVNKVDHIYTRSGGHGTAELRLATERVGAIRTVTEAYTAELNDNVILCDTTTAGFTVTLPDAAEGLIYTVKKIAGTGAVTIDSTDLIDGNDTVSITGTNTSLRIHATDTGWWIV